MNWYDITKKYNNIGYKLGSIDLEEGLDCSTLMLSVWTDLGYDTSKIYSGEYKLKFKDKELDILNYMNEIKEHDELLELLIEFIKDVCVKKDRAKKGDIIVIKFKEYDYIGIYCGQNKYLTAVVDLGCRIYKLNNETIKEVYSWEQE